MPRFASLHADKVFLRKGPGDRYPVDWVFVRRGWPVEILGGFDHWRHVRDWQGTDGWVHEKMIATRREVVVTGDIRGIRQGPDTGAALLARAEPGVVAQLHRMPRRLVPDRGRRHRRLDRAVEYLGRLADRGGALIQVDDLSVDREHQAGN